MFCQSDCLRRLYIRLRQGSAKVDPDNSDGGSLCGAEVWYFYLSVFNTEGVVRITAVVPLVVCLPSLGKPHEG
jgi:hypothetical protein